MTSELRRSYDAFPYESHPFRQTHPDRLATIGRLFGLATAPVDGARVLEVGCAAGGNLLPMACSLPRSEFVGIDFSEVQIGAALHDAQAVGASNVRFACMDIMDLNDGLGEFDYVIAHGVFSWVPGPVQEKLFALCSRHLAPHGVAYISYNTLPGWNTRSTIRAAMRHHTAQFADPRLRVHQARALLEFLAEATKDDDSGYGLLLRTEAEKLRKRPDFYIFHDHLEEVNEPIYFHDFVSRAGRHRLRYLGEAHFQNMFANDLAPKVQAALEQLAPELLKREQFLDYVRNRMFRETLLVHDGAALERKVSPLKLMTLHVASRAMPVRGAADVASHVPEEFRDPAGFGITTSYPLAKAALMLLAQRSPQSMPFAVLLEQAMHASNAREPADHANALASVLLGGYAAGAIELHSTPSAFVLEPGAHPATGRWQAYQAHKGDEITTLEHGSVRVDSTTRTLLTLLDGKHTREEVATKAWPGLPDARRRSLLDEALPQLARQALLVA